MHGKDLIMQTLFGGGAGSSGGSSGGGEKSLISQLLTGTVTEIADDTIESLKQYAICSNPSLEKVSFPNVKSIGNYGLYDNEKVAEYSFPNVETVGDYAMALSSAAYRQSLVTVDLPMATTIGKYAFYRQTRLVNVNVPKMQKADEYVFATNQGAMALKRIDLPAVTWIGMYAFRSCGNLIAVILRNATMVTLNSSYGFSGIYHYTGTVNSTCNPEGLKDGYFYVPSALVEEYKAATNWTTYADRFRALEDYTVDGTTTGELDETKI